MAVADRIPRFLAIFLMIILAALTLVPAYAAAECTVRGNVYDWATFDTIDNAMVEVYSIPDLTLQGKMVTQPGSYTFSLSGGDYMIVATAGAPGSPEELIAVENLTIPENGERIFDLILFPPDILEGLAGFTDTNVTPTLSPVENPALLPDPTDEPLVQGNWDLWLGGGAIALAVVAIAAGLALLLKLRPKKTYGIKPAEEPRAGTVTAPPAPAPAMPPAEQKPDVQLPQLEQQAPASQPPPVRDLLLPEDCRQVLSIIEKSDGRITQLDLRKMLPYSEAKVSLIVTDLESRGLVKKIKKGRGNVLILNRPGEQPPEK